ncbi:hypothetical protein A2311_05400 [candidate division WOR-1 bacterium RIFOXYB2_FULL_48_7]|uniref:Uncharacterized protein n=1 Tax=candidate division WOR-1 bacterium RIFOXYB2_FULL_48_7 TaxID=1802583 RepID=A0A1F4TSD9_UNCSA|nr:MAG: hypothetical protein A2311_05400 [candidate division WOR-1 bacterium RIFOXYB2_FULL_48_7]
MKLTKALAYGFLYFSIMFVIGSATGEAVSLISLVLGAGIVWLMVKQYNFTSVIESVLTGIAWALLNIALDYVIIVLAFKNGNMAFYTWSVILGYILLIAIPALVGAKPHKVS